MGLLNPLGIYEKALFNGPLARKMADAARAGYDCFEISIDETDERLSRLEWQKSDFELCRKAASDNGLQLFSVCLSGHRRFPLGSADKDIENKAMQIMSKGVRFCSELGVRVLQIAGYDVFYETETADTKSRFLENLEKGTRMAEQEGIMLSIEPVEKHITSVKMAMDIVRKIDSPWLTVYPDIANLYMMGFDPLEELNLGNGKITAIHMREAPDNEYIPFGKGVINFEEIFKTLQRNKYSGPLVVELWNENNPSYMEIVTEACGYLRRMLEKY